MTVNSLALLPSAVSAAVDLIDRHDMLASIGLHDDALIPSADLPAVIAALEKQLRPATKRQVAEAVAMIGAAWPFAHQRLDSATADAFVRMLTDDVAPYPADAIFAVIRDLRRTQRFTPAISEIVMPLAEEMERRRRRLRIAKAHAVEHARREAQAAQAVADRERERRAWQSHLDRLQHKLGDIGITDPSDIAHAVGAAFCISVQEQSRWLQAIEDSEAWIADVLRPAATLGRIMEDWRERRINVERALQLIRNVAPAATAERDSPASLVASALEHLVGAKGPGGHPPARPPG